MASPGTVSPPGLIIAAGKGSRLAGRTDSKPLLPLFGRTLIEWVIRSAQKGGIHDFLVVTGYNGDKVEEYVQTISLPEPGRIRCVHNPHWEKENGLSVLCAKSWIDGVFVLMMADHLFTPEVLKNILALPLEEEETILAIDRKIKDHPTVNPEDVTKVRTAEGRIIEIGKSLKENQYDAFDTGLFRCTPALFSALQESSKSGDSTLSGGARNLARRRKLKGFDIGDSLWIDIDDENDLAKAEKILPQICR